MIRYYMELLVLDWNTWNYLTVCKQMSSGLFKCYLQTVLLQVIYIQYTYVWKGFGIK